MRLKFAFDVGFVFVRQVIHDVAFLVDLAALDEGSLAGVASHGRMQRFAAVEDVQPRRREVQSALHQFTQQSRSLPPYFPSRLRGYSISPVFASTKTIMRHPVPQPHTIAMSRQSEKFLIGQSRKFLLTAEGLKDGTDRDEPKRTGQAGMVETG